MIVLYRYIFQELGAGAVGVWSLVTALSMIANVSDFGIGAGVSRFMARSHANGGPAQAAEYLETAQITLLCLTVIFNLALGVTLYFAAELLVKEADLERARDLLPFAIVLFQLNAVGALYLSALDGSEKNHVRSGIITCTSLTLLPSAQALVPRFGLEGLCLAQILQSTLNATLAMLILKRSLPGLQILTPRLNRKVAREALTYGSKLQLSTIAVYCFEPITKALLAKYGSLETLGYFEGVSRVVGMARNVMLSGAQVLVPVFARLQVESEERVRMLYKISTKLLFSVALIGYASLTLATPLIAWALWGHSEPWMYLLTGILSFSWAINTLAATAYFENQGTGIVKKNLYSHLLTAGINLPLGIALGNLIGAAGVIFAWSLGLVAGSTLLLVRYEKEKLVWSTQWYEENERRLLVRVLALLAVVIFAKQNIAPQNASLHWDIGALVAFIVLALPLLLLSELGRIVPKKFP